jgi:hypothetical protein
MKGEALASVPARVCQSAHPITVAMMQRRPDDEHTVTMRERDQERKQTQLAN